MGEHAIMVANGKAWTWVQPRDQKELLERLLVARDLAVPERERENLCGCAHTEIQRLQRETLELHAAGCAESERADAAVAALPVVPREPSDGSGVPAPIARLLHALWTKHASRPDYIKADWVALQLAIAEHTASDTTPVPVVPHEEGVPKVEKLARTFAMEYLTGHYRPLREDEQKSFDQLTVVMLAFASQVPRLAAQGDPPPRYVTADGEDAEAVARKFEEAGAEVHLLTASALPVVPREEA